ncbi:hypothetical protein Clole_2792 [Cellulosilyticum lentocellum DSM 5427]|uniref:Uncharacterized protein n=1 Tax=Cellulosilyticum lentocellum (strain ATCC 49066 / DSM 5427 / NCIMB 11756 / RHM5) TaxID=642492 RepID=F2JK76_CELLD|nr:hypothetical protein Clole_2792 [Cellulosilyticum lentocellum DSM 5427]
MTWGYILVLSTVLFTSWKVGQPMIAKREKAKRKSLKVAATTKRP